MIEEQLKGYKVIKDPLKAALSGSELRQLKILQASRPIKIAHLDDRKWLRFSELFAYNTNAIEGSTVTLKEVRRIIEKDRLPDKSKEDIAETYGVVEAVEYIRKTKEHISLKMLLELHHIIFKESKNFAGSFRKDVEVVIRDGAGNIIHRGAPSKDVIPLLEELISWYEKHKKVYPHILLAAVVHNQFENIHPFQDGNGRIGRLLLNNILLRHGLPPANIELKRRRAYYECLQIYEHTGNIRPTVELILKEYKSAPSNIR
jgi:Fic family protein